MDDIAVKCVADIRTKLQSIAVLNKKHLHVYSPEDLVAQIKNGVSPPVVGVMYEGMRAAPESQSSYKVGGSAELVVSLILIYDKSFVTQSVDAKTPALNLLDDMRNSILGTKSPSGHQWKFMVEASGDVSDKMVVWLQRWATPVQLFKTP